MTVREFQRLIAEIYGEKDAARGLAWSFAWLVEEVGELGAALRNHDALQRTGSTESTKLAEPQAVARNLREEFADVLAWLSTLAEMAGVDLAEVAAQRYGQGCPYCAAIPCTCASTAPSETAPKTPPEPGSLSPPREPG